MKKKIALLLCCLLLILTLAGCSSEAGGKYILSKITAEGMEINPTQLSMSMSFTLEKDGTGTAVYNGKHQQITWSQEGKSVYLTGENGVLTLAQSGKSLVLDREGTILTFEPEETEEKK